MPGLQFTTSGAGQTQVTLRGVTAGTSGSQTVGIYVDDVPYGASTYHNLQVGYQIEPINARVELGVDNVFDKQPPILFQNNVTNGNTDPVTFDTVGRYYWARFSVKF